MMILKKGVLIVFEGIDGAGKTTQAEILLKRLKKKKFNTVYFREPSQSKWGREIKKKAALLDSLTPEEELDLFQRDRKENIERNLKPALKKRKVVILDRYYFSTIAYQGAKGIDPGSIQKMNEEFVITPDLVFIFDIDAGKGLKRIEDRKKRDMLFERKEYLIKVREIFQSFKGKEFIHVDATEPMDIISKKVERIVFNFLDKFIS